METTSSSSAFSSSKYSMFRYQLTYHGLIHGSVANKLVSKEYEMPFVIRRLNAYDNFSHSVPVRSCERV